MRTYATLLLPLAAAAVGANAHYHARSLADLDDESLILLARDVLGDQETFDLIGRDLGYEAEEQYYARSLDSDYDYDTLSFLEAREPRGRGGGGKKKGKDSSGGGGGGLAGASGLLGSIGQTAQGISSVIGAVGGLLPGGGGGGGDRAPPQDDMNDGFFGGGGGGGGGGRSRGGGGDGSGYDAAAAVAGPPRRGKIGVAMNPVLGADSGVPINGRRSLDSLDDEELLDLYIRELIERDGDDE